MLEPFVRPRAGIALNLLGAVVCGGLAVWNESVTTRSGSVELALLMPGFAAFFLVRVAGIVAGERAGRREMPWGHRVAAWLLAAGNAFVFGILASVESAIVIGGLVAADVAGALAPKRPDGAPEAKPSRLPSGALILGGAAALVVALHFLVAIRFAWWPLFDWGAAVVIAMAALRLAFARPGAAREEETHPPALHRVHDRTERPLADPQREHVEAAVRLFRERGDLAGLTALAEKAAASARMSDAARADLLARVRAAAARPGTTREDDLAEAVAVLERALDERERPVPVARGTPRAPSRFTFRNPGGST